MGLYQMKWKNNPGFSEELLRNALPDNITHFALYEKIEELQLHYGKLFTVQCAAKPHPNKSLILWLHNH